MSKSRVPGRRSGERSGIGRPISYRWGNDPFSSDACQSPIDNRWDRRQADPSHHLNPSKFAAVLYHFEGPNFYSPLPRASMSRLSLVRWSYIAPLTLAGLVLSPSSQSTPVDPALYAGLAWRNVGPFRGGRIAAVSGVIGQPGVFYVGLPAGGVWKTTSAGETWFPVFDSIKTVSSVGAIEVAPSDPNVIYVGTGEMPTGSLDEGDGVYKSVDAGRTWQHLGLDSTTQIPSMLVDPHDPNLVMIASQGNLRRRSDARGVYRSTDGGKHWTKTFYVDDKTGVQKLARAF